MITSEKKKFSQQPTNGYENIPHRFIVEGSEDSNVPNKYCDLLVEKNLIYS